MATIYDVAARAGVSIATVSRVLHGKDHISDKTIQKVMQAVTELDYSPQMGAQMLSGGTARNILVILPLHPVNAPACLSGIDTAARANGYNILIGYSDLVGNTRIRLDEIIASNLIAGVICQVYSEKLLDIPEIPFVAIGENPTVRCSYSVISNDRYGTAQLTKELVRRGRRRFAYVSGTTDFAYEYSYFIHEREAGMVIALQESGLPYDPGLSASFVVQNEKNYEELFEKVSGYALRIAAMPEKARPDAIICAYDYLAMILINALTKLGVKVPEDIAVTGFDNDAVCVLTSPAIATAASSYGEIGRQAAEMLFTLIGGKEPEEPHLLVDPEVILRASAG
ncbi:MAG: LacI family DNA-binding transcriptional regulator [Lachnospiraceae bacterium]|nr:LacI family DNA-binding transcriptional regulator [Lachnospiraceae bacterium]